MRVNGRSEGGSDQYFWELLGLGPVPVPEAGQVDAVDPLPLALVIQVRLHLGPGGEVVEEGEGPDGLVQLHGVPCHLGALGELQEQPPALQAHCHTNYILDCWVS